MSALRHRMRRGYISAAMISVAIGLTILSMVSPVVTTSADFSIFNTGWNGTSSLALSTYNLGKFSPSFELRSTGGDVEILQLGFDDVSLNQGSDVLAVIGPTKEFSAADGSSVGAFVRAGGRVLLADDFGTGNGLLEAAGAGSRFSGRMVFDLSFEKTPEFPICFDIVSDPLTDGVTALQLNYATSIAMADGAEPLVRSSVASWLDTDGDRLQDFGEPEGPFVVAARERLGLGEFVLIADPSLLINGMQGYLDNAAFVSNLVTVMSEDRTSFLFDESHRDYFDPIAVTTEAASSIPGNAKAMILFLSFFLAVWVVTDVIDRAWAWTRRSASTVSLKVLGLLLRRGGKPTAESSGDIAAIVDEVTAAHPEWRPGLVRYVANQKQRHDRFSGRL